MSTVFHALIYNPIYNLVVFLIDVLPGHSLALSVIATTIMVKLVLYPLSKKALISQIKMREVEPEAARIKEKYKGDQTATGRALMELYKKENINPMASVGTLVVQMIVIITLYFIVANAGLPKVNPNILYPFVNIPENISLNFFTISLSGKSILLAFLTAITAFIQAQVAITGMAEPKKDDRSFQSDMMRSMQLNMKYVFPIVLGLVAWGSAVIGLYLIVTNVFTIFQELSLRKHRKDI